MGGSIHDGYLLQHKKKTATASAKFDYRPSRHTGTTSVNSPVPRATQEKPPAGLSLVTGHAELTSTRKLTRFCFRGHDMQFITIVVQHNNEDALLWKLHDSTTPHLHCRIMP
jgi:hypothetical protein